MLKLSRRLAKEQPMKNPYVQKETAFGERKSKANEILIF
jgi:hypothetical protein